MIQVRCPICDKPMQVQKTADWPEFPFCSPRCRLIDLGRWLGEDYRIAPVAEGEDSSPPDETEIP